MTVRKIVEVTWFDAQSSMECYTIKEIVEELRPLKTLSVGYLIHENKDYIILVYMDFANGLIKHHTCIPKGMIEKIKVIRDGQK